MNTNSAILAGITGGATMSVVLALVRAAGLPVAPEQVLGTILVEPGPTAFLLGPVMHLVVSVLIALLYGPVQHPQRLPPAAPVVG